MIRARAVTGPTTDIAALACHRRKLTTSSFPPRRADQRIGPVLPHLCPLRVALRGLGESALYSFV
jgi:hypothetical protein